ncbi:MAG: hypothetical protein M3326_00045 [Actinomycetota bacterium]|nr:hypothetical protein [Actinomycetota bacterium]
MTDRPRFDGEGGATLVELLTAMTVAAVVLAFVTGTVIQALGVQRRQTAQIGALNDARLAFERTTTDLRAANPLRQVAPDRIQLDVRTPTAGVRAVTYERVGTRLVFTDLSTGRSRTLVGDLAAQPLFTFHLADGSTAAGEPVDPGLVRSITVRIRVVPVGVGRVLDLENRVLVRNARS